jgi:hypothetical protein
MTTYNAFKLSILGQDFLFGRSYLVWPPAFEQLLLTLGQLGRASSAGGIQ